MSDETFHKFLAPIEWEFTCYGIIAIPYPQGSDIKSMLDETFIDHDTHVIDIIRDYLRSGLYRFQEVMYTKRSNCLKRKLDTTLQKSSLH